MCRIFVRRARAIAGTALRLSIAVTIAATMAACAPKSNPELQWARAALERNPQLKVLEVDEANNAIKVRVTASGEIVSIAPGELAAIPIAQLVELAQSANRENANAAALTTATAAAAHAAEPAAQAEPATELVQSPPPPPEPKAAPIYTVQREDGRVKVSGPGVSIETASNPASRPDTQLARTDDPVICDRKMLLHLDGRTINAGGDAIIARGGCDLYITNSRISANGTALTVLDATVHVGNSELKGDDSSLTAGSAAQIYIRGSRFTGLSRRDPQANIQDQGGNTWR